MRKWEIHQAATYRAVTDPVLRAVLSVLAPGGRPVMQWPNGEAPTADEMIGLAETIARAVREAQ